MMRFVTIGDVHGHDTWKKAVYRIDEETGEIMYCYLDTLYDKAIFVGDYVDDWHLRDTVILHNLKEIIQLKKDYPDNVVLLWGNHDYAYYTGDFKISGFRAQMYPDLYQIFHENRNLFQLAFQKDNVIWTHAGIHKGWWQYYALPIIQGKVETRYTPFLKDCKNIADYLNLMFEFNEPILGMISHYRGGSNQVAGPMWADKIEIYEKPLPGYHQVVGHTPVPCPRTYDFYDLTKVTFVDCNAVCTNFFKIDF